MSIKKENFGCTITIENPIKIKLLSNFLKSDDLCNYWNKMSMGNYKWNNITITSDEKADYYVIINKPLFNEFYDPSKTIVFRMEPDCETNPFFNDWYRDK